MRDRELLAAERPTTGAPLEAVGRAERFVCDKGEVWTIPDAAVARRLLALGEARLGGFVEGGTDAKGGTAGKGAWVVRRVPARTLEAMKTLAWTQVLAIVRDLACALDACEKAGLFPGAVRPQEIALSDDHGAWLVAEPLVRALVGA